MRTFKTTIGKKSNFGVSPVIGVILVVAVTVALVALATVLVFDTSNQTQSSPDISVDAGETPSGLQVTVLRNENVDSVIVEGPNERSEEFQAEAGSTTTIGDGAGTYTVRAVLPDGTEQVVQTVEVTEGSVASDARTPTGEVTGTVSVNPNIQGAEVKSVKDGVVIDRATTDTNGEYQIGASENARIIVNTDADVQLSGNDFYAGYSKSVQDIDQEVNFDFDNGQSITINGETVQVSHSVSGSTGRKIANVYQLQAMQNDLTANYKLVSDIDASETENWNDGDGFEPIGDINSQFTGSIDGQEYVVDGLYIDRSGNYAGLIGYSGSGSSISNIGVVIDAVNGSGTGGLVGTNRGSITDSYAEEVSIGSSGGTSGGLVAVNEGSITDSYATGNVNADAFRVGGLVGINSGGSSITDSYATVSVNSDDQVGGLVGHNFGSITDSYATGNVTGSEYVGGFVGRESGDVTSSYATGNVTGSKYVGGFVGEMDGDVSVTSSYATGNVTGSKYVGGFIGRNNYGASVTSSYATGSVGEDSTEYVGGFVGYNDDGASVTSSYATGSVSGNFRIGGIAGEHFGSVSDSYWDIDSTGQSYGGLAEPGGTGLTTSEMQGSSASSNMSNLDFGSVWTTTSGYPELQNNRE